MTVLAVAIVALIAVAVVMHGQVLLAQAASAGRVAVIEAETVQVLATAEGVPAPAAPDIPPSLLESLIRQTVIVTTKTGSGFRGVLYESDKRSLVLRNAEARERDSDVTVTVDGELILLWADVEFVQRP